MTAFFIVELDNRAADLAHVHQSIITTTSAGFEYTCYIDGKKLQGQTIGRFFSCL